MPVPLVLKFHNSDIQAFKNCRRDWNWKSDLREGWKPIETPEPLSFGSDIHKAQQHYYEPTTWHMTQDPILHRMLIAGAVEAFKASAYANKKRYLKHTGQEAYEPEMQEKYLANLELGEGILRHYFDYVSKNQMDEFTPIGVEVGFEVDMFTPEEIEWFFPWLPPDTRILYCGRCDLIMRDRDGNYWNWDHKTTSRVMDVMEFLELDEQLGSYNMALALFRGWPIIGTMYAEIYKGYPKPPARLKNTRLGCNYSTARNQETSYELMVETLKANNEPLGPYEDYLNYLKVEGVQWVRRTPVHRGQHELEELRERIRLTIRDMLDPNLRIYPAPGKFKCQYCDMRKACIATNDGQDVDWILNQYYVKEGRTNA